MIRKEYWERALNQAQQDHERKESIQQDVHGENQNTFDHMKVKVLPKPYEPTKEERHSHEATHCPFRAWCEIRVKAKSLGGRHTKQHENAEHIPVTGFDYAFATDMLGDPNREDFDDGSDRFNSGSLERGERANLTIHGQLRAFRETVSMRFKTEIGPDHVLMGWMVRHCAWVVNNFQVKGTWRTPYRSFRDKDCTGEVVAIWRNLFGQVVAIWRNLFGPKPFRGWSKIEHEVDARSLSASLTAPMNFCC